MEVGILTVQKITIPKNCAICFFNPHNQPLAFDSAEKCLYSLLKKDGIFTTEVPMSLYLPEVEMVNYSIGSGNKPGWMGNHKLGLYEVTSLNGEKQLNEVKTNGNFKDNIENIINALNNYNKGDEYILVVACRSN